MQNNEDAIKKLGQLNLDMIRRIEAQAESKKGLQADEYWQPGVLDDMRDPFRDIKIEPVELVKPIKPVDFNFLELKLNQIKELPTDELLKLLSGESHSGLIRESTIQLISNEILSRQIKESSKPHWTVTPTFIVGCIAAVLAATSILVTIYFSVFYKTENNNKHTDQGYAVEKNSSPK